jgi:hypothetical protein
MDAVATAKLALDASGFDRGLMSAQSSVSKFAKQVGGLVAGAFAFDKIVQGFASAIEKGDQLQDIAEKFGISASKLQLLGNAASVFGSNVEQVSAGLNKLSLAQQKALAGDSGLQASFAEVGLSLEDLQKMKPEDILLRISDSFASGANNGRQFIIVNELLGKAQTDLIKVLNQGSEAIIAQGESMGVLSDDQIASLSEVSDAMKTLQITVQNAFGQMAVFIVPVRDAFVQFAEELTMVGYAAKTLLSGDLKGAMAVIAAARESHAESLKPKAKQTSKTPVMTDNVELASIAEEKKKQDKKLFDEELYDLQEASRLEANRDKTLFDRMMRDAEFSRDEKKRILALEKETAQKNREIIMRGMEASGTILDKARASAERLGNFGLVRQIDQERQQQQRQTDVSLLEGIGASPGGFGFRKNEQVQALTQTEGELQRTQNTELLGSFKDMQKLVTNILQKVDDKLGVPILRSAN